MDEEIQLTKQNTSEEAPQVTNIEIQEEINSSFDTEIITFIEDIGSLSSTLTIAMASISDAFERARDAFKTFEENQTTKIEVNGKVLSRIEPDDVSTFNKLLKEIRTYIRASTITPRSFIVTLVSQYDAFLGRLLKILYLSKPELLNSSTKELTLAQLMEFNSLEKARSFILEKEIESVLRKSHIEQFTWMEEKFKMKLRKDLQVWPCFVELTERRNLFVHNDGVVSNQYIDICKENNIDLSNISLGDKLKVTKDYFEESYSTIFEIGFKLGQVLWRKFNPQEIEKADSNLISIGYDMLCEEKYKLTKMIFDFALECLPRYGNEEGRRVMVVNRALAYKWDGENEKAKNIITHEDWSATKDKFRLAEAIILEDYDKAFKIMRNLGNNSGEVCVEDYREWPLFKEIKKEERFLELFEEVFNEPYNKITEEKLPEELTCDSTTL